jgi:peptidoglycan/xylan/chitin deacetylase (PgdA/CDA1 family)
MLGRVALVVPQFALVMFPLFQRAAGQAASDSVRVPILVYHSVMPHHPGQTAEQRLFDVDTAVFSEQMRYLAEHRCRVISFARLIDALEGRATLPERAVVITFDDGWENQFHHAFPVLRQLGLTATFFVYTVPIGRDDRYMTWDQLRQMQKAGMTIGSHSRTHPELTAAHAALNDEIDGSRRDMEEHLGTTPDFFAYPYGAWNARALNAVRAAGYLAARGFPRPGVPRGPWNASSELFALRAVMVTDDMDAFAKAIGIP